MAVTVSSGSQPVLDIACGMGHLEHYLSRRHDATSAVGMDMNFYHVWIARHWMAPMSRFVCANAEDGLPFADGCFSAVICSDAYHYLPHRNRLLREIDRCAPGQRVVLTRVGNAAVMPNEGVESTLAGYLAEFGASDVRVFDEDALVRSYLTRSDVFQLPARPNIHLSESKWLSFAWNLSTGAQRTIAMDTVAPHAVGRLGINPLYVQSDEGDGGVRLTFQFPTAWYAYENHRMLEYQPLHVTASRDMISGRSRWQKDPALRRLVDSMVLLGLPDRFESMSGSP